MNRLFPLHGCHHAVPVRLLKTFLQSLIVPRFQVYVIQYILVCACGLLCVFYSPTATSQLTLLTPNGGEKIQAGREFVIRWSGIDSLKPVRLEFSIDSGRSWRLITDTARGYSYLWKPIPVSISDSCFVQISSAAGDSTASVNASKVTVVIPPSTSQIILNPSFTQVTNQTVTFSPDGTKILVTSWSDAFDLNGKLGGWLKYNVMVLDGTSGNTLYTLPAYTLSPSQTTRPIQWWSSWAGYDWSKNMQAIWHPNSQRFLTQLTDSTLGVIDAANGTVIQTIAVPSRGNSARIASMQWIGTGAEILVTAVHRYFHSSDATGASDTLRSFMMRIDAASGMLTGTPFQLKQLDMANPGCDGWNNWGGGSISHNGERFVTFATNPLNCSLIAVTMHSTADNSLLQTFPTTVGSDWWSSGWGGNANIWSPDDTFLAFCQLSISSSTVCQTPSVKVFNASTGQLVQYTLFLPTTPVFNWLWSPDSRKILLDAYDRGVSQRFVLDIQTGTISPRISPTILNRYGSFLGGGSLFGWGNLGNITPTASGITWSPDNRYIAAFLSQNVTLVSSSNTVGIWNAETGCLLQTFSLPFPGDSAHTQRSFFQNSIQWSADGQRLLLFSPWLYSSVNIRFSSKARSGEFVFSRTIAYDGTALILKPNIPNTTCLRDVSDSLWSLVPQSFLRANDAVFLPLVCEETTATLTATARNFGTSTITMIAPKLINNAANEFSLLRSSSIDLATTDTFRLLPGRDDTLTVQFTLRGGIGQRTAEVQYIDSTGTTIATMTLLAGRDSLNLLPLNPPDFRVNLGRVLQFRSTGATPSFVNTGTAPLLYETRASVRTASNLGTYPFLGIGKSFRIDSVAPAIIAPGETGRYYLTFLGSATEGVVTDSIPVFECGAVKRTIVVSATVIPFEPRIEIDSAVNFGRIICSPDTVVNVRIRNVGGRVMTVYSVSTTNRAFIPQGNTGGFSLQPLESLIIPIRFLPITGGTFEAELRVASDDPTRPTTTATLRGQKTLYSYAWQSEQISFGDVPFGRGALTQVQFTNQGTEPFFWSNLPQTLSADYVIVNMSPNPLQVGSTATVTMRFAGRRQATTVDELFTIRLTDACQTRFSLNLITNILPPQARIFAPDTVRLPRLFCETELATTITIRNDGDAELRINSIAYQQPIVADFPTDTLRLSSTTVAPQASETIRLLYRPSTAHTVQQTIVLGTNDRTISTNGEVRIVVLAQKDSVGMQVKAQRTTESGLSESGLSFSTVEEYTVLRDTLLLSNTGTVPLVWQTALNTTLPKTEVVNVAIDSVFVLERIEPPVTAPNQVSRLIVRFRGNQAGFSATRTIPLEASSLLAPNCIRTTTLTLSAEVRKEPRLAAVEGASARILCETATTFTIRLHSIGTDSVVVQSVEFVNNPNNIFTITRRPSSIAARSGRDSIIVVAETVQNGMVLTGPFTAQIGIRSNAANASSATVLLTLRKDSSGIQAEPPSVDFATLPANTSSERIITLRNTGTIPQGFVLPLRAGMFVLDSLGTNPIPSNSPTSARVRFVGNSPNMGGVLRDTLRLTDSCGRVISIPLQVRVIAGVAVLPDTVAVQVGDIAEVPVTLTNRAGIEAGMEAVFSLRVENTSLLDIVAPTPLKSEFTRSGSTSPGTIAPVAQILSFQTRITSTQESESILRLRVRSLLGNATTTTLRLENVQISGVAVQATAPTHYRTRGINYAGGSPRLVYSPNIIALTLAPNPVQEELRLSLTLRETAALSVEMTDVLGKKHLLTESSIEAGFADMRFPTRALPSGVYMLVVRVGNEAVSRFVTVVR